MQIVTKQCEYEKISRYLCIKIIKIMIYFLKALISLGIMNLDVVYYA